MKQLFAIALLCTSAGALAADKTAPKTTKTEPKAQPATPPPAESKDLKVEEPDQKDPKNKKAEVKAEPGTLKKEDL